MTPDEVQAIAFRKPRIGNRGYDEKTVDAMLDRIEGMLRGTDALSPDEVSAARLRRPSIGRRGYREEDVDAFLARVLAEWPAH
jgi:DivIVA domain-containing protein